MTDSASAPSYQRSISSLGCPQESVESALALARHLQLDAIELRSLEGGVDLPALFAKTYGTPEAMAAAIGVPASPRICSLDTSLKLFDNTDETRAEFLEFLPWAETLGVHWLRWFDGGKAWADDLPLAIDTWQWWTKLRAEKGWQAEIMIETHDLVLDSAAIIALTEACPGIKILWDTHHTWKVGGEDPVKTWQVIKSHVPHIHVKDSVNIPSARHSFSYRLPGEGQFPMAPLQALLAREFDGVVSLEWERHWHPYLAPVEDAVNSAFAQNWW
ncbi:sugar phosphate isomerase/epimerase family protein [Synoicihabitans lomoniglobus]|uniref:TIM barrel protein n=1 Tax=Synoicihabitans lomoniglobus TaxID=2909285 RepID=A0AAF0I376_9BACT|nr:sugar phosphate isomerase/epimerase [Opitutaceae bacterium LMO-M01]WED66957.1 TIM barrel protein [Opitutaceae bacterium LMO-M01]